MSAQSHANNPMPTPAEKPRNGRRSIIFGLGLVLVGLVVFLVGAVPRAFGLDRSPVFGFVQISVFLVGLALICLGGYITLATFWGNRPKTIRAEIGQRLVSTGYVVAVVAGMADVFGLGSHSFPSVPYFGPWQAIGVVLGALIIGIGFVLLIPPGIKSGAQEPEDEEPPKIEIMK
ncbi:MAG: hypothetical protein R3335_00945 [Anaerolineales bacterium]|nr:hypothetical protein [Anaerolineales bacterium]